MHDRSILIVEDNQTLRRLLEYRLGKYYRVRSADNGESALDVIEDGLPDLIISDIMMPKMDGFALLAALRNDDRTRTIPFIFLTAKSDETARAQGLGQGVDDYISKPFDVDYLLNRVRQILERTKVYQTKLNSNLAKDFSDKLLPKTLPNIPGYRTLFYTQPKEAGGGDLFDWVQAGPNSYLFTVGDIMGKGLQAKFYAFSFLSYIRSMVHTMLEYTTSPGTLMRRVNEMLIKDQVLEETFASLLLMLWEPDHHRVTYASAGHCRPILVMPDRAGIVEYSDMVLGLDPGAEFHDKTFELPSQSALLCYTDGLIEQTSMSGQQFGEIGVAQAAKSSFGSDRPVHELLTHLLRRSQEPRFADDILVFWLQRN